MNDMKGEKSLTRVNEIFIENLNKQIDALEKEAMDK